MIELPEACVLARQMNETLAGKTIARVQALQTPHGFAFFRGDAQGYAAALEGLVVAGAHSFGGRPELRFRDSRLRLSFNDGVNLRYFAPGEKLPAKHQFMMGFDDGGAVCCTVQMYGFFGIYDGEEDTLGDFYYRAGAEKPSPLSGAFDLEYFNGLRAAAGEKLSAKAFLATEQRVPGLGNGVLQDILWRAGVHPKRKIGTLAQGEWEGLFSSVKQTLAEMTDQGGRDTEKDLFGRPGGYQTAMSRKSPLCPGCGGPVTRMAYLGGNVYVCGACQKL